MSAGTVLGALVLFAVLGTLALLILRGGRRR